MLPVHQMVVSAGSAVELPVVRTMVEQLVATIVQTMVEPVEHQSSRQDSAPLLPVADH